MLVVQQIEAPVGGPQPFRGGDAAIQVEVGAADGLRFVQQGDMLAGRPRPLRFFSLSPRSLVAASSAAATAAVPTPLAAAGLTTAGLRAEHPRLDLGDQFGRDLVLIVGDLEAVDHPVAVGVDDLEEGLGVGPELSPVDASVVIGVGPREPGVEGIAAARGQPERLTGRAHEQGRRARGRGGALRGPRRRLRQRRQGSGHEGEDQRQPLHAMEYLRALPQRRAGSRQA